MLEAKVQPHREFLQADQAGQKLFVALKLKPQAVAAAARPDLSIAFVVDTSGSMREVITEPTERTGQRVFSDGKEYEVVRGAKSKMDLVVEALQRLLETPLLLDADRLALIKFDDTAQVVQPFTSATQRAQLSAAAERLNQYSGGTSMGAGMREGLEQLVKEAGNRRMVLLTDGHTFDEDVVQQVTDQLTQQSIPVTAIGVGNEWNDSLIATIADRTQGKPFHVVADAENPQPPSLRASDLPREILEELRHASNEVVTQVGLSVKTVKDVVLNRITRVFPVQTEVDTQTFPHPLGNVESGDWTVYILEFTLPGRPAARLRLAQLGLTYQVPGKGFRGEVPAVDLVVEFTHDNRATAQVDQQVMQWVQQRNLEGMIKEAIELGKTDPAAATRILEQAKAVTVRLGQSAMTQSLDKAAGELQSGRTISLGTQKTLRIGSKTQTIRAGDSDSLPTDEEIRRITGT